MRWSIVIGEKTFDGWEVRLRPRDAARFGFPSLGALAAMSLVTVLGEGRRLELTESTDGDGDHWYDLATVGDSGARRALMHTIHDPTDPRLLGEWLARRARIPLDDRIPTVADRTRELDAAREALAATGKFGRLLSRLLPGKR